MAASAGTVLSEERVRGSLDVLLATPLSTRSIVWGKWWGAFRRAPWLAFWPALIAYATLPSNPSPRGVAMAYLIPTLIILQGAALAGLGLALATWISRTGRAVAWTITALVGSVVGWPIVGSALFSRIGTTPLSDAVSMGSPFWNAGYTTHLLEQLARNVGNNGPAEEMALMGLIFWGFVYGLMALGLYLATLFTFDRCLGRTPERPADHRPSPAPGRRIGQADPRVKVLAGGFDGRDVEWIEEFND